MNHALTPTQPGQLARVYLENFMTYDSIEVKPGFHLNLIIGPNGTGKSTIVCAVLLGLNGKLKTLGRAEQPSSYIKTGCGQCLIELELYRDKKRNVIIRRLISSNNQSSWFLNGSSCPASKINELRKEFNIQVDNLCTFLPQEKVQSFAEMDCRQLLESTQKTVGENLYELHEQLKKIRQQSAVTERNIINLEENLETEKQKNERLEGKVKSIQEKRSLVERITLLNQKKAWLLYHESVEKKKEIDKDAKLAQDNFRNKQKQLNEIQNELKKVENDLRKYHEDLAKINREELGKKAVVINWIERVEAKIDKLNQMEQSVAAKLAEEESKKVEMASHQSLVNKYANDLRSMDASNGSQDELNQQGAEIQKAMKTFQNKRGSLTQKLNNLEYEESELKNELRAVENEKETLENRRRIRMEYLKRYEPDAYTGVQWLHENRGMFEGEVYNPMLLEINVTDPTKAKYVETSISYKELLAFTCTIVEDMDLLVRKLRTEKKLMVHIVSSVDTGTQFMPAVPIERLKRFGFYAYLKDFIQGPDPIIQYLCRNQRIYEVPVGDASVDTKSEQVPPQFSTFYSANYQYKVKVSAYSGNRSSMKLRVNEPKLFSATVDEGRINYLKNRARELNNNIKSKRQEINQLNEVIKINNDEFEELRTKIRDVANKSDARAKLVQALNRSRALVDGIKKVLKNPDLIRAESDRERQSIKNEMPRFINELVNANKNLNKVVMQRHLIEVDNKGNTERLETLKDSEQEAQSNIISAQEAVSQMKDRLRVAESDIRRKRDAACQLTNGIGIDDTRFRRFKNSFEKLKNTPQELEEEILETQARADFLDGDNANVLEEYENRKVDIEKLTEDLETARSELNAYTENITDVKQRWLQPLNTLIKNIDEKFGRFFTTMGCAGEVSLVTGENENDFEQYGIKIQVKFRDGVALQELSRHFQSGGERAVSTAIYMLSLQELTSVPFRFVDEINQGMDPANERRIFELIVRVTSSYESSQYFFITPKLLPSITCTDTMSVLCVYNGPSAIASCHWDLTKFLRKAQNEDDDGSF